MCVCVFAWRTSEGVKNQRNCVHSQQANEDVCALFTSIAFNTPSIWWVCVCVQCITSLMAEHKRKTTWHTQHARTHARPQWLHGDMPNTKLKRMPNGILMMLTIDFPNHPPPFILLSHQSTHPSHILLMLLFLPIFSSRCRIFRFVLWLPHLNERITTKVKHSKRQLTLLCAKMNDEKWMC